jgi:hypothetical protein
VTDVQYRHHNATLPFGAVKSEMQTIRRSGEGARTPATGKVSTEQLLPSPLATALPDGEATAKRVESGFEEGATLPDAAFACPGCDRVFGGTRG